jgi:CP family cyanate transporter-like MFS transporter
MGLQATVFYTLVTWLPSIESDQGVAPGTAGTHLFAYQAVGIFAALAVGALMARRPDQRGVAVMITVPILIALAGLIIAPGMILGWAMLAGLTSGSSIAVALALIGLRSRNAYDAARLSGMAQSMGYLLAAGGPIAAGALREATGSWQPVIIVLIMITLGQAAFGALAGRNRYVGQHTATERTG